MDLVDALIHAFGALATGDFSSKNASVGAFASPFIENVTTTFMVIAGMNFTLIYQSFLMIAGRLEASTVLVPFAPSFWRRR